MIPRLATCLLLFAACMQAQEIPALKLISAVPVEGSDGLDLSGLAWQGNSLLAVSDKTDDRVFRIEWKEDSPAALLVTEKSFSAPAIDGVKRLDFEGITTGPDGFIWLVSETSSRILEIAPNGKCTWLSRDISKLVKSKGLLAEENAGLEGITLLDGKRFLLCAERQPRGLIEIDLANSDKVRWFSWIEEKSIAPVAFPRFPDYSDICNVDGKIYAISRNAEAIVQLKRESSGYKEVAAWSFSTAVRNPDYAYIVEIFGQIEGLAIHGNKIYLVADNNRSGRKADPKDRRAMLFVFERPDSMK